MDDETRAEIAELHKRERMRGLVSVLFVLAIIAGFRLLTLLACALWAAYLVYCARREEDRAVRIVNMVVMVLPVGVFIYNVIMMIKG